MKVVVRALSPHDLAPRIDDGAAAAAARCLKAISVAASARLADALGREIKCDVTLADGAAWPNDEAVAFGFSISGASDTLTCALTRADVARVVSVAAGGEASEDAAVSNRALTALEENLLAEAMRRVVEGVATGAGAPLLDAAARRLEVWSTAGAVLLTIECSAERRIGAFQIAAPIGLFVSPEAEGVAREAEWRCSMHRRIDALPITLAVTLEESATLGLVGRMKVGDVIRLQSSPQSEAVLSARGLALYRCRIGQVDDRFTVRIDSESKGTTTI